LAVDLVAAPASQEYVERMFLVCGDFTAERETRPKKNLEKRVFFKINTVLLADCPRVHWLSNVITVRTVMIARVTWKM